jgi:RNA polymerase sigma-70 factor (ECF subfamily)
VPGKVGITDCRAAWLSRNILPHECALRAHLSRWRLPDDLDADDVVQEAYAKLAMLDDVDGIRNPKAYFFQAARSIVMMHVRRLRVVSFQAIDRIDQLGLASEDPGPDVQVSDRQQLHLIGKLIAELPSLSRAAMTLRLVHELSHREIGARLGMTPNAVQKSLTKSLSTFVRQLGRGGRDGSDASKDQVVRTDPPRHARTRDQRRD